MLKYHPTAFYHGYQGYMHACLVAQSCLTLLPHELQSTLLHCPRDSPSKNTRVDSYSPLQGIFLTQGWNSGFLRFRQIQYCLSHQRSSIRSIHVANICVYISDDNALESETYHMFLKENILKLHFDIRKTFTQFKDKIQNGTL